MERGLGGRLVRTGARVPKMAKCCFWVTASLGSAPLLQSQNTSPGNAECLAALAYCCKGRGPQDMGYG